MEQRKMHTPSRADENFRQLAALFPRAVTETVDAEGRVVRAIDKDVLMEEIGGAVVEGGAECYQFTWPGKRQAALLAGAPAAQTLCPCREESVGKDGTPGGFDSENLWIEGDNLEALKLLRETHQGSIRMIYIDPPYNTGHDLLYQDDFSQNLDAYLAGGGQAEDAAGSGRLHAGWLSMIYPRLLLARDLLAEDGVILISIDDHEAANLKKVGDEVFGEEQFLCCFNWNTKKAAQGMATVHMVVSNHEYILAYCGRGNTFRFRGLDRDEKNGFSNPDQDPRGPWKRQYLQRLGQGLPVRTLVDPATGHVFSFETPYTQDKLDRWVAENRILFPEDPARYPARKEFLAEYPNRQQLVTSLGLYPTKAATEKLYRLFDGEKIFTTPRPDARIKFLVEQAAGPGDIVLDFFSGSATTGQAVMQQNARDGGGRTFILVQLPEPIDPRSAAARAGYRDICAIGRERLRRAGAQIRAEHSDAAPGLDLGFRVLRCSSSPQGEAPVAEGKEQ